MGVTNFSEVDIDTSTGTATSGAVTVNAQAGVVTSEALTTAAAGTYTLTLTNDRIGANSLVFVSIGNGTNSQGVPVVNTVTPSSGSVAIVISNEHATQAFNGTLTITFVVLNQA